VSSTLDSQPARITTLPGFQEMLAYAASGCVVAVMGAQTHTFRP
jgi:hypothetical protein